MKASLSRTLVGLLAAAGLIGTSAQAQVTATGNFNVNIALTSKCEINSTAAATGAVITDIDLTYTSFQTTAATGSTSFNVRCTNGLDYTLGLDSTSVTDAALNLDYTLALSATSNTGNGANQAYTVAASMAAGQAGTCATATCDNSGSANRQRTLTITY
jgi:hypothetical protein